MDIVFRRPEYAWLFAVVLPLLVGAWVWIWHKSSGAREAFMPSLHHLYEQPARVLHYVLMAACSLCLAAFPIFGLMHPERRVVVAESVFEHIVTLIAIDGSSSMKSEEGYFGEGGRFGAVKRAFVELLSAKRPLLDSWNGFWKFLRPDGGIFGGQRLMEGQRIGLVYFAGRAITYSAPTTQHEKALIPIIQLAVPVSDQADDGTYFPAAIEEALTHFEKTDTVRVLILLTDGEEEEGKNQPLEPIIEKAIRANLKIFPIVVGHERAQIPGTDIYTEPGLSVPNLLIRQTVDPDLEALRFDERDKLYPMLAKLFADIQESSKESVEKWENLQGWCAVGMLAAFTLMVLVQYLIPGQKSAL